MGKLFANVEPIHVYYERKMAEKDELAARQLAEKLAEKDRMTARQLAEKDELIASLQKQLQELTSQK